MPRSPSIVPEDSDRDIYIVLDDFGPLGRSWRETDDEESDRETLVRDLLDGQYGDPVRIIAFNTAQGWSRDVTEEIADELRKRCADVSEISPSLQDFLDEHGGRQAKR